MPGMHGDELVSHIRKILPQQPIIMATAFANEYEMLRNPNAFVDALRLKPFNFNELRDAITAVLAKVQLGTTELSHSTFPEGPGSHIKHPGEP